MQITEITEIPGTKFLPSKPTKML